MSTIIMTLRLSARFLLPSRESWPSRKRTKVQDGRSADKRYMMRSDYLRIASWDTNQGFKSSLLRIGMLLIRLRTMLPSLFSEM